MLIAFNMTFTIIILLAGYVVYATADSGRNY